MSAGPAPPASIACSGRIRQSYSSKLISGGARRSRPDPAVGDGNRAGVGLLQLGCRGDESGIRAAARQSGADTFIEPMPDGYATLLGPEFVGGTDLSVGQ